MSSDICLMVLADARYGGWITFTAHLYHMLKQAGHHVFVLRQSNQSERTPRDFGYGVPYLNFNETDLLRLKGRRIVAAVDKTHRATALKLVGAGAGIVIHDPTELKEQVFRAALRQAEGTIVIRRKMLEWLPRACYVPHPYLPHYSTWNYAGQPRYHAVSFSRIDYDKHTEIILAANRRLSPEQQVRLFGAENRMYSGRVLKAEFPEYLQDSQRPEGQKMQFARTMGAGAMLARESRWVVDMSAIVGDGGGTQYTFLEAMDGGAGLVLNRAWLTPDGEMRDGENCFAVDDAEGLVDTISQPLDTHTEIRAAAWETMRKHEPKQVLSMWKEALRI